MSILHTLCGLPSVKKQKLMISCHGNFCFCSTYNKTNLLNLVFVISRKIKVKVLKSYLILLASIHVYIKVSFTAGAVLALAISSK